MTISTIKARRWLQTLTLALAAGISGALFAGDHDGDRILPPVDNAKWRAECGSCHLLYHPALLPERSWSKIMSGLERHFGENAKLDAATQQEIAEFLATHAADRSANRRAQKIALSTQAGQVPLRITETAYFIRKHGEIRDDVWQRKAIGGKANCTACHADAEKGNFDERAIRVPR
ncbi:MAG: diheme cytochrome c [Sterolibacterium sp.]